MLSRPSWDEIRMNMCRELAKRSTCWKKQTAAIITKDNRIISEGYNGTLSGDLHCAEVGPRDRLEHRAWSEKNEIHGEINAILIGQERGLPEHSTMYTLLSPCIKCAQVICSVGIKRVVYSEEYKSSDGLTFLKEHGVSIELIC